MTRSKAMSLAAKWAEGGVCTLREDEAREYHKICLEALRAQQQPNVPMTLDELREIDGVVWVCYPQATFGTQLPPTESMSCSRYKFSFADYGKTWLAYRRKPEEGTT